MRVLGDRVLVALPPKQETLVDEATGFTVQDLKETDSGILIAKPTDEYNIEIATRGLVMQVGEKVGSVDLDEVLSVLQELQNTVSPTIKLEDAIAAVKSLAPAAFDVAVGDCVLFPPSAGEQFALDGLEYVILREAEIIGVVEPLAEGKAA